MSFQGRTALHMAASSCFANPDMIKTLLENGCQPNGMDEKVNTAFIISRM